MTTAYKTLKKLYELKAMTEQERQAVLSLLFELNDTTLEMSDLVDMVQERKYGTDGSDHE